MYSDGSTVIASVNVLQSALLESLCVLALRCLFIGGQIYCPGQNVGFYSYICSFLIVLWVFY